MKSKILELHAQGFSVREIAKITGVSKSKVHRIIKGEGQERRKNGERNLRIYKSLSEKTRSKIKTLLTFRTEEKGRSRVLSNSQIYEMIKIDLIADNVKLGKKAFYEFIDYFIVREFGSHEKLEKNRRLKKELAKYVKPKGTVKREIGLWEIDATGYSYNGKNYSIMNIRDSFSGYFLPPYIIENKEKNVKYYNKAFNSLDLAYYFMTLFIQYGVPKAIKSDNEKVIKNQYLISAFKQLEVKYKNTKSYNPGSKLIEKAFDGIKGTNRLIRASGFEGSFEDLWHLAIETYNKENHNFKHIQGSFSPVEIVQAYGLGTKQLDEEIIRQAFSQRFERKVINNQIQIDNLIYEFIHHKVETDLGRKRENLAVVCLRDIENITNLFVYSHETGEYLGVAKLISQPIHLDAVSQKQAVQKQKRVQKRVQKLEAEKTMLEVEAVQEDPHKVEISTEPLYEQLQENLINEEEHQEPEEENILEKLLMEED